MHITFVKKRLRSGEWCPKCGDVESRLRAQGYDARIDDVLIADEADPESAGQQIAARLNVDRAPFFVVLDDAGTERVYTVYFRFVKEVLDAEAPSDPVAEASDLQAAHPDLDLI